MSQKISPSSVDSGQPVSASELYQLGAARVTHAVYDAVYDMWTRRESEGCKKIDLAHLLGRHPSWVTRALAGPGNWTLETFGALAEALSANVEVNLIAREDVFTENNYDIYAAEIDGVAHSYCPLPGGVVNKESNGASYTVNVNKPQAPTGMSTIKLAKAAGVY